MLKKIIPVVVFAFLTACAQPAEKPCCCKSMKAGVQCPMKDKSGKEVKPCCCKDKADGAQCPMHKKSAKK